MDPDHHATPGGCASASQRYKRKENHLLLPSLAATTITPKPMFTLYINVRTYTFHLYSHSHSSIRKTLIPIRTPNLVLPSQNPPFILASPPPRPNSVARVSPPPHAFSFLTIPPTMRATWWRACPSPVPTGWNMMMALENLIVTPSFFGPSWFV